MTQTGFLPKDSLQSLIDALVDDGRIVVAPTIDQDAIVYDEISSAEQLPRGWTDDQAPGTYRLAHGDKDKYFGFTLGPHSWKKYFFPPRSVLATATRESADAPWQMATPVEEVPRLALLGVRACELAAIRVQDNVFLENEFVDPIYAARRQAALIIAVNCTQAASTCFCTSTNSGPKCSSGFDLAMTEVSDGFLIESATDAGNSILQKLHTSAATAQQTEAARAEEQNAVNQMSKSLDTTDIRDLLLGNLNNSQWDDVATRCLSCTNCTMVCPTCFCSSVSEVSDLDQTQVERVRQWDSCFDVAFSNLNGTPVRDSIKSRYRQWLTHKLASWHDQFDESGCVGCGRCITWCPPGIDLTEEVAAIRRTDQRNSEESSAK